MTKVYLAMGSNVGDSMAHIINAQKLLTKKLNAIRSAPLYQSKAVGYTDQPDFTNTVICAETDMSPLELLDYVKQIENQVGRTKTFRWGPREIDIDIIFFDDLIMDTKQLTIPHPRFAERDFVLRPLCDLNPDMIDPLSKKPISTLVQQLPDSLRSII